MDSHKPNITIKDILNQKERNSFLTSHKISILNIKSTKKRQKRDKNSCRKESRPLKEIHVIYYYMFSC